MVVGGFQLQGAEQLGRAHADEPVDGGEVRVVPVVAQRTGPREGVVVIAVDERAVDVDERSEAVHHVALPARMVEEPSGYTTDVDVEDARWITVDGRRWRATDPKIPPALRRELVDELMAARRAVARARRAGDDAAERTARDRVHRAKVALGERGEPWWAEPSASGRDGRLRAAVLALAGHRAPDRTICPSDAARAVGGDGWRSWVVRAREVARDLARAGEVDVLQRGERLDPDAPWNGPIRIRARSPVDVRSTG